MLAQDLVNGFDEIEMGYLNDCQGVRLPQDRKHLSRVFKCLPEQNGSRSLVGVQDLWRATLARFVALIFQFQRKLVHIVIVMLVG